MQENGIRWGSQTSSNPGDVLEFHTASIRELLRNLGILDVINILEITTG